MTTTDLRRTPAATHVREAPAPYRGRAVRTVPRWWRDASGAAFWAVLVWVTVLWVGRGGVQDLGSVAGALTSTGRLTGLIASALLLVQVFLMARVPWFEQAWGQDELARTHRLVGFTSFNLLWAHIVLITLGYAAGTTKG
ncbi:MAG: ferric reductase-like transmembrane domain-containing protein, partial [Pedococcus sp.]